MALSLAGPLISNAYLAAQQDRPWQLTNALLSVVALLCGVVARRIYDRSRADEDDLSALVGEEKRIRSHERTLLASELDTLMAAHLGAFASDLERRVDDDDVSRLRAAVARVDSSAHQTLLRLRRAVGLLREPDAETSSRRAENDSLRDHVEEAEGILVAHGHPVEVEADNVTGLSGVQVATLGRLIEAGTDQALQTAPPGTACQISVRRDPSLVRLRFSHYLPSDDMPNAESYATSLDRVELLGGGENRTVRGRQWLLDAWLEVGDTARTRPLVVPEAPEVAVPTTWRQRLMQSLDPERVGVLAALPWAVLALRSVIDVFVGAAPASLETVLSVAAWVLAALLFALPRRFKELILAAAVLLGVFAVTRQPLGPDMWLWITAGVVSVVHKRWFGAWVVAGLTFVAIRGVSVGPMVMAISYGMASWLFLAVGLAYGYFLEHRERLVLELERQRQEILDARAHERRLLAGELHDVVAHQLSLITMQAGALADIRDVPTLQRGLRRLAELNRSAESDLNVLKRVMSTDASAAPMPDLHRQTVTGAAEDVSLALRSAGFRLAADIAEEADALEPSILHTVVRLLRECSTNMLRYAPPGRECELSVRVEDGRLLFLASNPMPDGRHADSPLSSGLGLRGLAERISLQEGSFYADEVDRQWVVTANLPAAGIEE